MEITEPVDFQEACKQASAMNHFINIMPWESESSEMSLSNMIKGNKVSGGNIFIGPEGGFENEEVEFAKSLSIKTVSLGENILRVETAAIVSAVLVLNSFGVFKSEKYYIYTFGCKVNRYETQLISDKFQRRSSAGSKARRSRYYTFQFLFSNCRS